MWFARSNLVDFEPLTPGDHLGFCDKWEIVAQACLKGQVVCPCKIWSKSDEREPNAEPKCDLLVKFGQFWTFDPWRPSWILRWMRNSCADLFLGSRSMFMPNFVQIWWTRSKCRAEMSLWGQIWSILDLWPPAAILDFAINEKFLRRLVFRVK